PGGQHSWAKASASGPRKNTRPMCDRSNRPHAVRTARCSARMPVGYWTGMSQPAKSTMRAPRRRCSAFSGVASSPACGLEGEAIAEYSRERRGDEREPTGEEQHAHANHQHTAHTLNGQHVAAKPADHDERAVDGDPDDQER